MPLDPSIPLSAVAPPQPVDLQGPMLRARRLRDIDTQQQIRELQLEKLTQERTTRRQLRDLAAEYDIGTPEYLQGAKRLGPDVYYAAQTAQQHQALAGAKVQQAQATLTQANLEVQSKRLDIVREMNTRGLQALAACLDAPPEQQQECYARSKAEYRQYLELAPIDADLKAPALAHLETFPDLIDPQRLNQERLAMLALDKQLQEQRQTLDYKRQQTAITQEETIRHNKEMEGIARENQQIATRMLTTGQGMWRYNPRTGEIAPVVDPTTGEVMRPRMSQGESAAMGFGIRAKAAAQLAQEMEDRGISSADPKSQLEKIPFVGNYLVSADLQQYNQAKRDFVTAVLRKESGATITPAESAEADRLYFPVAGDSREVIAQKRRSRQRAIAVLQTQAGRPLPEVQIGGPDDPLGIR